MVDQFLDIRLEKGEPQLLVKWKGFDDEEPQCKAFITMREDVPSLVEDFLTDTLSNGTARQRRIALGC